MVNKRALEYLEAYLKEEAKEKQGVPIQRPPDTTVRIETHGKSMFSIYEAYKDGWNDSEPENGSTYMWLGMIVGFCFGCMACMLVASFWPHVWAYLNWIKTLIIWHTNYLNPRAYLKRKVRSGINERIDILSI